MEHFGPNVVAIPHAIQKYTKFAKKIFRILQHFATCPVLKLVYNGNCLLGKLNLLHTGNGCSEINRVAGTVSDGLLLELKSGGLDAKP